MYLNWAPRKIKALRYPFFTIGGKKKSKREGIKEKNRKSGKRKEKKEKRKEWGRRWRSGGGEMNMTE